MARHRRRPRRTMTEEESPTPAACLLMKYHYCQRRDAAAIRPAAREAVPLLFQFACSGVSIQVIVPRSGLCRLAPLPTISQHFCTEKCSPIHFHLLLLLCFFFLQLRARSQRWLTAHGREVGGGGGFRERVRSGDRTSSQWKEERGNLRIPVETEAVLRVAKKKKNC